MFKEQINKNKKIGIVSPSWNGPGKFPLIFEHGIKQIKKITKKEVVFSKHCISKERPTYQDRAEDINRMFARKDVDLIIASIGGSDSINILPFINKKIIQKYGKGKTFMGFSDTTTLLLFLKELGVNCIHGPSVMAGLSEPDGLTIEQKKHIKEILILNKTPYKMPLFNKTTYDDPNWKDFKAFKLKKIKYKKPLNPRILGEDVITGEIQGGNLETIYKIIHSEFFLVNKNWGKDIFFLETSEEKPDISFIKKVLKEFTDLQILQNISILLFGHFAYFTQKEQKNIEKEVTDYLRNKLHYKKPIVFGLPIGHNRPQWLLPYNKKYKVLLNGGKFQMTIID